MAESPHDSTGVSDIALEHVRTRSAPSASDVARCVTATKLTLEVDSFEHRWRDVLSVTDPFPGLVSSGDGRELDFTTSRVVMRMRRAFARAWQSDEETGRGVRARGPRALCRATRSAVRHSFGDETDERTMKRIEWWCARRLREELFAVSESLDDLEAFFEDARAIAANARAEGVERELGFEGIHVDSWSSIGLFMRRCCLGFDLLPFEATIELLESTRAYADAFSRACDEEDDSGEEDDPSLLACEAPDALTALAVRAVEKYDTRSVDADSVLPRDALETLSELAPELPTLHYLKHAEALRRRDYSSAIEHLHRHFDTSGEHDDLLSEPGRSRVIGGFETANAGRERLQTALLALASMQLEFSHVDEAMVAISEAVRTAQQNGDEASLAHALALTTALLSRAPVETSGRALRRDAQLPTLLRRLAGQAADIASPHLVAYASLAMIKHAIYNPSNSLESKSRMIVDSRAHSTRRADSNVSTPAMATQSLADVELMRHLSHLVAAAPASIAAVAMSRVAGGNVASMSVGNDMYPPPKGFPTIPMSAYTTSSTAMAFKSLAGTASTLAAEGWNVYGCKQIGSMYATRQIYHDRDATADETAASCASLIASTSECEGFEAASDICERVERMFGPRGSSNRITAIAFFRLEYARAVGVGDYAAARDAALRMRDLVDDAVGVGDALRFESEWLLADLKRMMGDFDEAQKALVALVDEANAVKDEHSAMRAELALAETHLNAGTPTSALMRALPLELRAAERSLEMMRSRAFCIVCECWLALGSSHAQLARDALDVRLLDLLASDDLRVQARAYVIAARSLIETASEDDELTSIAPRVIDAFERASERYERVGARRCAADALARIASFHHARRLFDERDAIASRARNFARTIPSHVSRRVPL